MVLEEMDSNNINIIILPQKNAIIPAAGFLSLSLGVGRCGGGWVLSCVVSRQILYYFEASNSGGGVSSVRKTPIRHNADSSHERHPAVHEECTYRHSPYCLPPPTPLSTSTTAKAGQQDSRSTSQVCVLRIYSTYNTRTEYGVLLCDVRMSLAVHQAGDDTST